MNWVTTIRSSYLPLLTLCALLVWGIACYFFQIDPPIGTYIAVFGVLGMVVTIWQPEHRCSKGVWLVVFVGLTFFEIHNLYRDREKHDREQREARERERLAFKSIADGITTSITENQKAFEATMGRMEGLAELAKNNLHEATGGDSFCYVDMGGVPPDGLVAYVMQQGRHPLFNVRVTITDLEALETARKSGSDSNISLYRQSFPTIEFLTRASLWHPLATYRIEPDGYRRFNIEIYARNGAFTELLRVARTKEGGWTMARLVTASYFDKRRGIVLENIHRQFPTETLRNDADWQTLLKLKRIKVLK